MSAMIVSYDRNHLIANSGSIAVTLRVEDGNAKGMSARGDAIRSYGDAMMGVHWLRTTWAISVTGTRNLETRKISTRMMLAFLH